MNLFRQLKLEQQLLQQNVAPPPHPWNQGDSKTTVGPDSYQAHPPYAQQIRSAMFQTEWSDVRSRDPLRPASTNKFHMPGLSPIRTRTL